MKNITEKMMIYDLILTKVMGIREIPFSVYDV